MIPVAAVAVVALMASSTCPQPEAQGCVTITEAELVDLLHGAGDELDLCESNRQADQERDGAIQLELAIRFTAAKRRADRLDVLLGQSQGPELVPWYQRPWFVASVSVVATVAVVTAVR